MKTYISITLIFLFSTLNSYAADIFVDLTAPPGGDGTSWATAYNSIDLALAGAAANDVINIAEGVYSPLATLNVNVALTIIGGFPTGGGTQNVALYTTEIRGDAVPANLLLPIFEIQASADTQFNGLSFTNAIKAINTRSSLEIHSSTFETIGVVGDNNSWLVSIERLFDIDYIRINDSNIQNNAAAITAANGTSDGTTTEISIVNSIIENNIGRYFIALNEPETNLLNITNCEFNGNNLDQEKLVISQDAINLSINITDSTFENNDNGVLDNRAVGSITTILNCDFTDNLGGDTIMIDLTDTNATIRDCTFLRNGSNTVDAEGIFRVLDTTILIEDCNFTENHAFNGFATVVLDARDSDVTIENSLLAANTAISSQPDILGVRGGSINVRNTTIRDNFIDASIGTAVHDASNSEVTFEGCQIIGNRAVGSITDGCMEVTGQSVLILRDSNFEDNQGTSSNFLRTYGFKSVLIERCTVRNFPTGGLITAYGLSAPPFNQPPSDFFNIVDSEFGNNSAGSITLRNFDAFNIENSTFLDETRISITNLPTTIEGSKFIGNASGSEFIGIRDTNTLMENTLIASTEVGGDHRVLSNSNGPFTLRNSTISGTDFLDNNVTVRNSGSDLMRIQNSIIWSGKRNLAQSGLDGNLSDYTIRHTIIKGENPAGAGNLDGTDVANAPFFVSARAGNFNEKPCSPTVNAGNNAFISNANDINDTARVFETTTDMGAFELQEAKQTTCPVSTIEPSCTAMSLPIPNATNVPVDTDISWPASSDATGYLLTVGTSSGAVDILDNYDVRDILTYDLPADLPGSTTIFVTVIAYNSLCEAVGCSEESFTTEASGITADSLPDITACGQFTLPALSANNYYYTAPNEGGTPLSTGNVITTDDTIYIFARSGAAMDETSFNITIIANPTADAPSNVTECASYSLPTLSPNNNYFTAPSGGGTMLSAGNNITTTQTIYVYTETGTTPNCTDENSFTVTINGNPTADTLPDVTECNGYVLPTLSADNNYFTATNGSGTPLNAGDTVSTSQTIFIYTESGGTPNCTDESSFDVTITGTPTADAPSDRTECGSYILPTLSPNNSYYTETNAGGTMLNAGNSITATQTLFVYAGTSGCSDENSFTITIKANPTAQSMADINECDNYTLPALNPGNNYYTAPNGGGTMLNATEVITSTQVIYIFNETGGTPNCTDETSFSVTITPSPTADDPVDVTECTGYILPALSPNNAYYTGSNGSGTMLSTGTNITATQTIYVYSENGTAPNTCSDENSFEVTITGNPTVDNPGDVTVCDSYILPALSPNNNYFTETNQGGTPLNSGDTVSVSQTIFIYTETGGTPNCKNESSFEVTIVQSPAAESMDDVMACTEFTLPVLNSGNNYFSETNGNGTPYFAGDVITDDLVLFIYTESGTNPNCSNETSFSITVNNLPTPIQLDDVTECGSFILQDLPNGYTYYDQSGATGANYNPGDVISNDIELFVYAGQTDCTTETNFYIYIDEPVSAPELEDVFVCEGYMLPVLNNGSYFTQSQGQGDELLPNTIIQSSQTIYIYDDNGVCSSESDFDVNIDPESCTPENIVSCMIFPKFFTPNADGANDYFIVSGEANCPMNGVISIYDRYGKLMAQFNAADGSWDGTFNGTQVSSSDYWYQYTDNEFSVTVNGHFTLKR